jgi:acetoin utilization deacetylase AcuC-like enzyme
MLVPIPPTTLSEDELLRFHTSDYLDHVRDLARTGGHLGAHAWVGVEGYDTAALAAGGCAEGVTAIMAGTVDAVYAFVAPPGHHAMPDHASGGCVFANEVLAVLRARDLGAGRVAVVDWDAHHGDGTQHAFYEDGSVLTISLHQTKPFGLGTGGTDAIGRGAGIGRNINVPLPLGSGPPAYGYAFDTVVLPALSAFRPDIVIVACGLDGNVLDPLSRLALHSRSFRDLTSRLVEATDELCDGRLVMCHEGGYSPSYVPFCGAAVIEALLECSPIVGDPYLDHWRPFVASALLDHEREAITNAANAHMDAIEVREG